MKRWLVLAAVVLLGAAAVGWELSAKNIHPPRYNTAEIQRGDVIATISSTGTIEPEEVVDVGAQVAGMIKSFGRDPHDSNRTIDYGSPVEEGTVLAQIDAAVYKAQVTQAQANLQRADAELLAAQTKLGLTDREWRRAEELHPGGAISDANYDTAHANFETAKSALAAAEAAVAQDKANLELAQINLGYTTIRSPVKGVIVDRRVNVGQTVVASLNAPSLFLIAKDLGRLQVWASVNEADIGLIRPRQAATKGQPVRFTVDAYPGDVFHGEVLQIRLNATMTQNVVSYTVVVETDNSNGKLLPYMTANLQFETAERHDVFTVPNAALRWYPEPRDLHAESGNSARPVENRGQGKVGKVDGRIERGDRALIWVPDGGYVRPVSILTGLSNGTLTEITGGDVREHMDVVVGSLRRAADKETINPFTPNLFGGSKPQP